MRSVNYAKPLIGYDISDATMPDYIGRQCFVTAQFGLTIGHGQPMDIWLILTMIAACDERNLRRASVLPFDRILRLVHFPLCT
jgi:hypothetical protein